MSERGASLRGAQDTNARVQLRGASARNGAAVYIGVPAASVAPPRARGGYPFVGADLTSHATAVPSEVRVGVRGELPTW